MNPKMNSCLCCVYNYGHGNKKKSYPKKWCAHCSDRRDPEILASWLGDLLCSIPGSYYSLTFTLCFSTMYFNPKLHRFWGWGSSVLPTDHMVTCLNALTKDTMEYDPVIDFLYKRSPFLHSSSTKDSHRALPGPSPPHISRQSFSCDSECSTWAPITSLISQEYYRFSLSLSRSSFLTQTQLSQLTLFISFRALVTDYIFVIMWFCLVSPSGHWLHL